MRGGVPLRRAHRDGHRPGAVPARGRVRVAGTRRTAPVRARTGELRGVPSRLSRRHRAAAAGVQNMSYRAIIFDLFDTLLYTTGTGTRDVAIARAGELGLTRERWVEGWRSSFELSSRGRFRDLAERVRHLFTQADLPQPG